MSDLSINQDILHDAISRALDEACIRDQTHRGMCLEAGIDWVKDRLSGASEALAGPDLEWSQTLCNNERVDYATAEKACAALGEGWRLPTRQELESILDLTRYDPAIDTERFPGTESGAYWSSTPCAWSSDHAWVVNFDDGYSYVFRRVISYAFVRAVRSVPAGQ